MTQISTKFRKDSTEGFRCKDCESPITVAIEPPIVSRLNPQQYASGKEELLTVLKRWEASGPKPVPSELQKEREIFDSWFDRVKKNGWTRLDVYNLIWDINKNHGGDVSEYALDELGEFETGITGFCASECIVRFPGDPETTYALCAHVRGERWK